jgi:hypothetical protein
LLRISARIWMPALLLLAGLTAPSAAQEINSPLRPWLLDTRSHETLAPFEPFRLQWQPYHDAASEASLLGEQMPEEYPPPTDADLSPLSERRTPGEWLSDFKDEFFVGMDKVRHDFINNYTGRNLRALGLTLILVAPIANTEADDNFQRWYQRHVRSQGTDRWARVGNKLGEHWVTVPCFLAAAGAGKLCEHWEAGRWVGSWGTRSIRALMVGSPAVGVLQHGLGAGRPFEYEDSSRWRPFHDKNGVAGHGFVGAVPFLTAASMTENRPLKALFFVGSFWTCWARINTDSHFLSQSILGWSIAFIAVQSVSQTEAEYRRWQVVPLEMPEGGTGLGVLIRY